MAVLELLRRVAEAVQKLWRGELAVLAGGE